MDPVLGFAHSMILVRTWATTSCGSRRRTATGPPAGAPVRLGEGVIGVVASAGG